MSFFISKYIIIIQTLLTYLRGLEVTETNEDNMPVIEQ